MQKTKKKRCKYEKNTKFSKMQKIKGFGAYSKMSHEGINMKLYQIDLFFVFLKKNLIFQLCTIF